MSRILVIDLWDWRVGLTFKINRYMKGWILFVIGLVISFFSMANSMEKNEIETNNKVDSIIATMEIPPAFDSNMDSLLCSWYASFVDSLSYTDTLCSNYSDPIGPDFDDSTYLRRLKLLSETSAIELPFNDKVKAYIVLYAKRKRVQTEVMLGLSRYYFPLFEEELDKAGLPMELKYLPVIESALNPRAFSKAGASGLWQFMYSTGKMYGLHVNSYIDERREPVKATKAAVKYLSDMYKVYQDWYLVIAAYNCGPGNVNKAIRRAGGKKDYWKIYYYLPRETRGYVPAFIAANYIMNYAADHKLSPRKPQFAIFADTVMVKETLHLGQAAEVLGCSVDELRYFNPQYRRDIIPAGTKQYALRLPVHYTGAFVDQEDSVAQFKNKQYLGEKRDVVSPSKNTYFGDVPGNSKKVYYTVKSGDNLGFIASWYNVGISKLRYWNGIRRNLIKAGQRLTIYVPASKSEYYATVNSMSFKQKQAAVGKSIPTNVAAYATTTTDGKYIYYKVKSGDNLWTISRKFPGTSTTSIKKLNNISTNLLNVGQVLKIKPKS